LYWWSIGWNLLSRYVCKMPVEADCSGTYGCRLLFHFLFVYNFYQHFDVSVIPL